MDACGAEDVAAFAVELGEVFLGVPVAAADDFEPQGLTMQRGVALGIDEFTLGAVVEVGDQFGKGDVCVDHDVGKWAFVVFGVGVCVELIGVGDLWWFFIAQECGETASQMVLPRGEVREHVFRRPAFPGASFGALVRVQEFQQAVLIGSGAM